MNLPVQDNLPALFADVRLTEIYGGTIRAVRNINSVMNWDHIQEQNIKINKDNK